MSTSTVGVDEMLSDEGPRLALDANFRLSSGAEWDTNPSRTVTGPKDSDALARLVIDADGSVSPGDGQRVSARYVLGAKRFARAKREDLLVHDLSASSQHALGSWVSLGTSGVLRASRIRSGERDYTAATAGLSAAVHPFPSLDVRALTAWTTFGFRPEPRFSFASPTMGGEVVLRATGHFSLRGGLEYAVRNYDVGLVRGTSPVSPTDPTKTPLDAVFDRDRNEWLDSQGNVLPFREFITFCDESEEVKAGRKIQCDPAGRRDREWAGRLRLDYRGRFLAGAEYSIRIQRSTSSFENVDRHRVAAYGTCSLPWHLSASLFGAIQFNDGASVSDSILYAEDDENQNSVEMQLSRRLSANLSLDLRYAVFAYRFTTAETAFVRQTVYLGLSYRGEHP